MSNTGESPIFYDSKLGDDITVSQALMVADKATQNLKEANDLIKSLMDDRNKLLERNAKLNNQLTALNFKIGLPE